jgi:hypothetical protein
LHPLARVRRHAGGGSVLLLPENIGPSLPPPLYVRILRSQYGHCRYTVLTTNTAGDYIAEERVILYSNALPEWPVLKPELLDTLPLRRRAESGRPCSQPQNGAATARCADWWKMPSRRAKWSPF